MGIDTGILNTECPRHLSILSITIPLNIYLHENKFPRNGTLGYREYSAGRD